MIAVDTNVLVYAHREEFPQHVVARRRVEALAKGNALWGVPVFCVAEFLRVVTHEGVFDPPYDAKKACAAVQTLLESPSLRVLMPGPRYLPLLTEAIQEADATGNMVFDAQIVALCRETGVSSLLTEDRDFARFSKFATERI